MRFYKLLLALPMIAFSFAMDANAGSCTRVIPDWGWAQYRNEFFYDSVGNNASKTAWVCGEFKADSGKDVACSANTRIVTNGPHYHNDGAQKDGKHVYTCDTRGDDEWKRTDDYTWIKNLCSKKTSSMKKMYSDGTTTYYCSASGTRNGGEQYCVATSTSDVCKISNGGARCIEGGGTWNSTNSKCDCGSGKEWNDAQGKCQADQRQEEQKCARIGGEWKGGICYCPNGEYYEAKEKRCKAKNDCTGICNSQVIMLSDFGNANASVHDSGNSSNTNENHNNSHNNSHNTNTTGSDVVAGTCSAANKDQVLPMGCSDLVNYGVLTNAELPGAKECAKQCIDKGTGEGWKWYGFIKLCNSEAGYQCQQFPDGIGCEKCTKGRSGGGSGGGSGSGCLNRPTAEGRACCRAGKDTTFKNNVCACVDTTKEWKYTEGAEYGECVVKGSTAPVDPCNAVCTNYLSIVVDNCAMQKVNNYTSVVTNISQQCANRATCDANAVSQLVNQIEIAVATCSQQPAEPAKPQINETRLAAAVAAVDKYRSGLDVSVWKDEEGNFNTARLVSDSIAGVVLGTAGGLITSSVVKKNQIKSGFEDIVCTVGGQTVGSYGDEISVGIQ